VALISRELLIVEKLRWPRLLAGGGLRDARRDRRVRGLDWGPSGRRRPLAGALAFGALRRDRGAGPSGRAAALAFLLSLPLAFLAMVPAGAVAGGLYDVIRAISRVFPYKDALPALDAAVNRSSPGLGVSLAHLLALTLVFGVLARVGLRRG
jgi:hypothetical protein